MKWKEEFRGILERIRDLVEGEDRAVVRLEKRCDKLEEQNKELFDRLMARNWETYQTYQPTQDIDLGKVSALPPEQDEDNAGLVMEIDK